MVVAIQESSSLAWAAIFTRLAVRPISEGLVGRSLAGA